MADIRNRIRNMLARGVVRLVNDAKKLQLLQVDGFEGGPADDAEHFQPYGFASVPLDGAEAFIAFPDGDREHAIVIATPDRRHRPTGGQAGEVTIYNHVGAKAVFKASGDIEIHAAPGRSVLVDDGAGGTGPLATKADVTALANFVQGLFVGGTGSLVVPPGTVPLPTGTLVLKAK